MVLRFPTKVGTAKRAENTFAQPVTAVEFAVMPEFARVQEVVQHISRLEVAEEAGVFLEEALEGEGRHCFARRSPGGGGFVIFTRRNFSEGGFVIARRTAKVEENGGANLVSTGKTQTRFQTTTTFYRGLLCRKKALIS